MLVGCALCSSNPHKTAELLVRTGRSDYYYCSKCFKWSKKELGSKNFAPVTRAKTTESLTWIYMSEIEMNEANLKAGEDIVSLLRKRFSAKQN
jgi:hypothetical protein